MNTASKNPDRPITYRKFTPIEEWIEERANGKVYKVQREISGMLRHIIVDPARTWSPGLPPSDNIDTSNKG